ncbi:MAG TPA: NADH-quinone oxidoreductase subunit C [Anaerolineales bacterium]|nr:NADH-quinone oxidoreductase subunit C [Anaerolineales bacterium]
MTREELTTFVTTLIPDIKPGTNKQYPEVIVTAGQIHELATALKKRPETKFDYLFCETAADRKDGFHMIYYLFSTIFHHSLMIRVVIPDKINPVIPTVSDVWRAAEFYEREIFDLFGIKFENHPNLKRIFLDDEWVGYPLRKDYKDAFTIER